MSSDSSKAMQPETFEFSAKNQKKFNSYFC